MIAKVIRTIALTAPLALAVGLPAAHAGSAYKPVVNALTATNCDLEDLIFTLDGAKAGSTVNGKIWFALTTKYGAPSLFSGTASGSSGQGGAGTFSYTKKYPKASTRKFKIEVTYVSPTDVPKTATYEFNRGLLCPGLPVTGSNAAPIGKIALGTTLGGALLATVAIRRRPRKNASAA